jgi:hypothetical protein
MTNKMSDSLTEKELNSLRAEVRTHLDTLVENYLDNLDDIAS